MEDVEYYPIDRWGWECPECGNYNEEEANPAHKEYLECMECNNRFNPVG